MTVKAEKSSAGCRFPRFSEMVFRFRKRNPFERIPMFDQQKFQEYLAMYKKIFPERWKDERFKWIAVKHFQEHWKPEAEDFAGMFMEATEKTGGLLVSKNFLPREMMHKLAKSEPGTIRTAFNNLFNENQDFVKRTNSFIDTCKELFEKVKSAGESTCFQDTSVVSTYLWLRYPNKYTIYRFQMFKSLAKALGFEKQPKAGGGALSLAAAYHDLNEIREQLLNDSELSEIVRDKIDSECWSDKSFWTLTIDFMHYISHLPNRWLLVADSQIWKFADELGKIHWYDFYTESGKIRKGFQKAKVGDAVFGYQSHKCSKIVAECEVAKIEPNKRVGFKILNILQNPVTLEQLKETPKLQGMDGLTHGKKGGDFQGCFFKLSEIEYQTIKKLVPLPSRCWLYAPGQNAGKWEMNLDEGIMSIGWKGLGDLAVYQSKEEIQSAIQGINGANAPHDTLAAWQFAREMKPGDIVYAKKGTNAVIGRGVVMSAYEYDENISGDYKNIRHVNWENWGEHSVQGLPQKTLTDITGNTELLEELKKIEKKTEETSTREEYTKTDFLREVFMSEASFNSLAALLERKRNIILQGAPGTGKTFAAGRLAYAVMGEKDDSRIGFVQFHQNYSYEDFVKGYKPAGDGFELKSGIFYRFVKKAAEDRGRKYFFIIDEINRGNISKIFGELLMLIEKTHRGESVTLAYDNEAFTVPENLYLIGMMNTADRSIAFLDYALRRRFSFFDMEPAFENSGFEEMITNIGSEKLRNLIRCVRDLNNDIADDSSLGKGFRIGHSYFCGLDGMDSIKAEEELKEILRFDIAPTLQEYWFDNPEKAEEWVKKLMKNL